MVIPDALVHVGLSMLLFASNLSWLPREASTWSAIAAVSSLLTAVAALIITVRREEAARVRGRRAAMTAAHLRMTSGEVATARQHIGGFIYDTESGQASTLQTGRTELVSAFYTIAWTIEYVDNVRKTWLRNDKGTRDSVFLRWNEGELHRSAVALRSALIHHDPSFAASSADVWSSVGAIIAKRGLVGPPTD